MVLPQLQVYIAFVWYCIAGCSGGQMTAASVSAGVRKCQDLPVLEEEGGDVEGFSFSLWSLSSEDAGAAELL